MALIEHIRNSLVDSTGKIREYYLAENVDDAWFQQVVCLLSELKTVRISINNGSSWTTVTSRGNVNLCELFYGSGTSRVLPANANVIIEISEYVAPVDYSGNGYYNSASITTGGTTYTPVSNRITVPVNKITKTIADVKGTPETSTITIDFPLHVESVSIVYKDKNGQEQTLNMTRAQYDAYIQTYGTHPTLECWSGTSASVTKTYEAGYESGGSSTTETDWAIGRPSGGTQGGSGNVYYIDDEGQVSDDPADLGDLGDDESPAVESFTFTLTKNSHIDTIKIWRTSSPYQGAATSTESSPLINGTGTATIYYGDVLAGKAYAATGYHFGSLNSNTTSTFSNASVTANDSWSPTVNLNSYSIKFLGPTSGYGSWNVDEIDAYHGDAISRSSNTVTITGRGSSTFTPPSNTAQYYYTVTYPTISSPVTAAASIRPTVTRNTQTYTITLTNENGYWEQGATTITQITNVPYGTAISKSGTTLTVGSTNYSFNANSATAQYTYSNPQIVAFAGSTVTGNMTIHGKATANLRSYTVTLSSTNGYWKNSGGTTVTTAGSRSYGTTMSKSGTTLTVGSDTYTFNANANTAQYNYTNPTIGTVPSTVTGAHTISGSATRTLRSYTVTIYYHFEGTPLWSDNRVFNYGTQVNPDIYFENYSDSNYTYSTATYDNPQQDSDFEVTGDRTVSVHYINRTFTGTATITFTNPNYGYWDYNSKTATANDYLYISGNTVTCRIGSSSGSTRWTNTLHPDPQDDEFTYTASITSSSRTVNTASISISSSSSYDYRYYYIPVTIYFYVDGTYHHQATAAQFGPVTYWETLNSETAEDIGGVPSSFQVEGPGEGDLREATLSYARISTSSDGKYSSTWSGRPVEVSRFYVKAYYITNGGDGD